MKFNYNPDLDIKMEFKLVRYPSILNEERVFNSTERRALILSEYLEEKTGIKMNRKSFRETPDYVVMEASLSNVIRKKKIIDYITINESNIEGDCIKLDDEISCYYRVKNDVYSPVMLKEDMLCIVNANTSSIVEENNDIDTLITEETFYFIVESNGNFNVELLDEDIEEIYDDPESFIDEDDFVDGATVNESLVRKKLIRGGKTVMKRKSTRQGYKFSGGREVRMSSKEIRDRKIAQMKASRKRHSKMRSLQRSRKKSLGMRGRRIA